MSDNKLPDTITFQIRRLAPGSADKPIWKEYAVAYSTGMTVLDGLWQIKERFDATLAWRASCQRSTRFNASSRSLVAPGSSSAYWSARSAITRATRGCPRSRARRGP